MGMDKSCIPIAPPMGSNITNRLGTIASNKRIFYGKMGGLSVITTRKPLQTNHHLSFGQFSSRVPAGRSWYLFNKTQKSAFFVSVLIVLCTKC